MDVFSAFREWASGYVAAGAIHNPEAAARGRQVAIDRRAALYRLIKEDPASALREAIPMATRKRLPPAVDECLEERVTGVGDYVVTCAFQTLGSAAPAQVSRYIQLDARFFEAFVYGRRTEQLTKYDIPIHGIAIDGAMALSEDVLRPLEPGELPSDSSRAKTASSTKAVTADTVWAEAGGILLRFDSQAELVRREAELRGYETGANPRSARYSEHRLKGEVAASTLATNVSKQIGNKRALVVRVDFPDLPGDPCDGLYTASYLQRFADTELSPFFERSSYGASTVAFTVTTNLYRMPESATQYSSGNHAMLHLSATKLVAGDYRLADFDRFIVVFSSLSSLPGSRVNYAGLAEMGGERLWINGEFTFRVLVHELGHSFGLSHANLWQVRDGNPVSESGSSLEYGDPFDAMGSNFADDRRVDYNPRYKVALGWLGDESVQTIATSGTYRVFAFDAGVVNEEPLALKVVRDSSKTFWISYRANFTNNPSLAAGAYVIWGYEINRSSDLLDLTTPGVEPRDAGLSLGRHLFDHIPRISLSVVGAGGTASRKYLDVQVRFGNTPPVITRQPKDILAAVGQTFVVEVGADGIPVPACQWQRQTAGTSRWEDLSDGQEATGCHRTILTVKNTSPTMRGDKFRCVVSNAEGLAESLSAVLEVQVNGAFVLAGEPGQYGNADGASSVARFAYPGGIAVDSNGDLYVADSHGHTIRKVSPQGEVTTFAGRPDSKGYRDGPVHTAQFDWPRAVALGADGTLYVTDHGNSVVRQISPEGDVSTLAGGPGNPGSKDGPGDVALFRCPWGIVVDGEGTVFVSDVCDNTVRRITPGGIVSTFAGLAGVRGAEDGPGNIARFRDPTGMAVDQTGNVYVADLSNNTIRKISPQGMVSTIAGVPQKKGNLDGPANQALFNAPSALAVDHAGNIYVADRGNNNVRKISLNGMVTTIAGPDENRVPPSYSANMRRPAGIAIAPDGLYVADTENQVLWWIVFPPEPPVLRIVRNERSIQLSYEPTSGDFILETAESLEPGAVWIPQELPVRPSSHRPALELPITSATRFFRLRSR